MFEVKVPLMENMGSYFKKWRECRNSDLGKKSYMSINKVEKNEPMDQPIKPINQSIDQSIKKSINYSDSMSIFNKY